jgi:RNA polymerase sigma factor (sigma-70 family)
MTPPSEPLRLHLAGGDEPAARAAVPSRVRGTDRDWGRLIETHQHRVVMSLMATGLGLDRARELANEAWARLMEKDRKGALTKLELPGLAIVQARFLAWDERRRDLAQRRQQPLPEESASEELLVDGRPDPEQRLLTRQRVRQALEAVATSPPTAQRLFRLLYADPSLPHARAAEELGLSVQRVRHVLCELRKRVRDALEGGGS